MPFMVLAVRRAPQRRPKDACTSGSHEYGCVTETRHGRADHHSCRPIPPSALIVSGTIPLEPVLQWLISFCEAMLCRLAVSCGLRSRRRRGRRPSILVSASLSSLG